MCIRDSLQPLDCEANALPTELTGHKKEKKMSDLFFVRQNCRHPLKLSLLIFGSKYIYIFFFTDWYSLVTFSNLVWTKIFIGKNFRRFYKVHNNLPCLLAAYHRNFHLCISLDICCIFHNAPI